MRNGLRSLYFALFAVACFGLAGCQGSAPTAQPAGPQKKSVGGTIQGKPSGGKFVVSGNRGTFTVDMSASTFGKQGGGTIQGSALKDGDFITVSGTVEGDLLKASKITLIHEKGQLPDKPTVAAGSPGG